MELSSISSIDLIALVWFATCWLGYTFYYGNRYLQSRSLIGLTYIYRRRWSQAMLRRNNVIVDSNLVYNLMATLSFYANTSILILAGLVALLGNSDRISGLKGLPFTQHVTDGLWEIKTLVLIVLFVFAFFKFSWSIRQFNILNILIGCLNPEAQEKSAEDAALAEMIAKVNSYAATAFNQAESAYYFGLAALAWYVHPGLFMLATALVTVLLLRRDFHSDTRRALKSGLGIERND